MATAVHLGPAAMDWRLVDGPGQEQAKRQSWDSSQALISLDSSCSFIKVPQPLPTTVLLAVGSGALLAGRMLRACRLVWVSCIPTVGWRAGPRPGCRIQG